MANTRRAHGILCSNSRQRALEAALLLPGYDDDDQHLMHHKKKSRYRSKEDGRRKQGLEDWWVVGCSSPHGRMLGNNTAMGEDAGVGIVTKIQTAES